MKSIVECVPNFSEGRDPSVIRRITDAIAGVEGIRLLHVDSGEGANRTVVTFVGSPEAVAEAAFRGAKTAAEVIDMRRHHGTHPRIGATDVLPLVPVSGITLEACAQLARQLAQRLASEAGIPCYAYEAAALRPEHKNLAVCRAGEYESLHKKLTTPGLQPDYMPDITGGIPESVMRSGCSVVGARDFLIAVNFNLNTTSRQQAHEIAACVREKGGGLKGVKALGWFIDEYGIAQVSMNITDIHATPLHVAYEEVCRAAEARGLKVTGTEIIGLVPRSVIIDAGTYFLKRQQRDTEAAEEDIVGTAIRAMGLDDLRPFNPKEKIIEYIINP